ncbi:MAG: hypothetical protein ACFCU5_05015 [Pleurocapsa sp.]
MFEIYIKLVGSNKVENYLKESLFIAIAVENWRLIEDIADFIQNHINISGRQILTQQLSISPIRESNYIEEPIKIEESDEDYVWKRLKYFLSQYFEVSEDCIKYESIICEQVAGFFSSSSNDKKYHSDFSSNADDLTCIELMMAVEEEFDLEIPDEKCSPYYMMTVKDLYDAIISCLKDQE